MYVHVFNALKNRFYTYSGITSPDAYIRKLSNNKPHLLCAWSPIKLDHKEIVELLFGTDTDSEHDDLIGFISQEFHVLNI